MGCETLILGTRYSRATVTGQCASCHGLIHEGDCFYREAITERGAKVYNVKRHLACYRAGVLIKEQEGATYENVPSVLDFSCDDYRALVLLDPQTYDDLHDLLTRELPYADIPF